MVKVIPPIKFSNPKLSEKIPPKEFKNVFTIPLLKKPVGKSKKIKIKTIIEFRIAIFVLQFTKKIKIVQKIKA